MPTDADPIKTTHFLPAITLPSTLLDLLPLINLEDCSLVPPRPISKRVQRLKYRSSDYFLKTFRDNPANLQLELETLLRLKHVPHIIRPFGIVISNHPYTQEPPVVLRGALLEYAARGSLEELIIGHHTELMWHEQLTWATHIAEGLFGMHSAGVVHGDLKPANIVIDHDNNVLIIDVGAIDGTTYGYCGPEMVDFWNSHPDDEHPPTPSQDIYALGVTLFQLAFGTKSSGGTRSMVTEDKVDDFVTSGVPKVYSGLIERCLRVNPEQRPTALEVLDVLGDIAKITNP